MMQEIICLCDEFCCFPWQKFSGIRPNPQARHPEAGAALHPAAMECSLRQKEASTTNGLLIQFKEDDPKTCGFCAKELNARPCDHCHGTTWGKPVVIANGNRYDGTFCQECSKLPSIVVARAVATRTT